MVWGSWVSRNSGFNSIVAHPCLNIPITISVWTPFCLSVGLSHGICRQWSSVMSYPSSSLCSRLIWKFWVDGQYRDFCSSSYRSSCGRFHYPPLSIEPRTWTRNCAYTTSILSMCSTAEPHPRPEFLLLFLPPWSSYSCFHFWYSSLIPSHVCLFSVGPKAWLLALSVQSLSFLIAPLITMLVVSIILFALQALCLAFFSLSCSFNI